MIKLIKQFYVSAINAIVAHVPPEDLNDILILRLDELGDFVLWLDSAKEYRRIFPNKRLTLLMNKKWEKLARKFTYWDHVIGIETFKFRFNPLYRLKILLMIRKLGFNFIICPRYTIKFLLEPSIVAISGATKKIVYRGNYPLYKENYYSKLIPDVQGPRMEINRNADFIRAMGLSDFKSTIPKIELFKKTNGLKYFVVCPTSLRDKKEWSLSNFMEIASRTHQKTGMPCILASDVKIPGKFPDWCKNLSGKSDILQFTDLLCNAQLVIANDSGAIHLAAAQDVPAVAILGGGQFGRFLPYEVETERLGSINPYCIYNRMNCFKCDWHCMFKERPCRCVASVRVAQVWETVKRILEGNHGH